MEDAWSLPSSGEQEETKKEEELVEEKEESSGEDARYETWRAHWRYLYETMVEVEMEAPMQVGGWLPGVACKGDMLEARALFGSVGQRKQHYLTGYKAVLPSREDFNWHLEISENTGELGGHGVGPNIKVEVEYRLYHEGPVSALSVWSCNPSIIVTRSLGRKEIMVFNRAKQLWAKKKPPPADRSALLIDEKTEVPHLAAKRSMAIQQQTRVAEWEEHQGDCRPDLILAGLPTTGDALDISTGFEGHVAAGAEDGTVLTWKLQDASKAQDEVQHTMVLQPAEHEVRFLKFNPQQETMLLGGGDATSLWLADCRASKTIHTMKPAGLEGNLYAADWNLNVPTMFAVGDSTGAVTVLDIRNTSAPLHTLRGHTQDIYTVAWSPHQPSVLSSGSTDCNVCLWDLRGRDTGCHPPSSGLGGPKPPTELYFKHAGHSNEIGAVSWIHDEELRGLLATTDIDPLAPSLQIWRPRNSFWVDS